MATGESSQWLMYLSTGSTTTASVAVVMLAFSQMSPLAKHAVLAVASLPALIGYILLAFTLASAAAMAWHFGLQSEEEDVATGANPPASGAILASTTPTKKTYGSSLLGRMVVYAVAGHKR